MIGAAYFAASLWASDCDRASTQAQLNACYGEDFAKADRALNKIRAALNADQKAALKNAQAAWIDFRDLAREFETINSKSGSIHTAALGVCLTEKTNARIAEIEKLANCEEGDITCVR
jgi:uncharacterized protein YecT (DUF1311 family)